MHQLHFGLRQPLSQHRLAASVLLDVRLENRIERFVGGKGVVVALVGAQLGAGRARDDRAWNRPLACVCSLWWKLRL